MKATKVIDQSLKNKISANEQKLKSLFKLKKNINNKTISKLNSSKNISKISKKSKNNTNLNISNGEINSFRNNNKENQKNLINLELTPIVKTNITANTSLNSNNNKYNSFIKPSLKNCKNNNNYKPKIKMKYKELECFINVKQANNSISSKTKKVKNKSNSLSNKTNRNMSKSNLSNIDCTSYSSFLQHKKSSKSFDFSLTYERFIENESKKKERISKIKKRREKFENRLYPHKPKINQKSKSLTKSITDDFLLRLEKYKKEQIEKEELLKRSILKDEEEKINKNNFLIIQKRLKKKRINDSVDKTYNNKTITECVNKLFDWEKKRKEKIENEIKKLDLIEKNSHVPKINKYKIDSKKNDLRKIYDRLYNKNKYTFEFKKELLTQESTPKFRTLFNKAKTQSNISYNLKKIISSYSNNDNKNSNKEEKEKNNNSNLSINKKEEEIIKNNNTNIIINDNICKNNDEGNQKNKNKSIIVVIRKIKSQMNILTKNKS